MTVNYTDLDLKQFVAKSLGDTGLAYGTYTLALIGQRVKDALIEFSRYIPYKVRHSAVTKAETKEVDISTIENLIHVDYAEFHVNQIDREFRNVIYRRHGFITLDITWTPADDETVYLYCKKLQTAEVLDVNNLDLFTKLCGARVIIASAEKELTQTKTDMGTGRALINTVPKGRNVAGNYLRYGQGEQMLARERLLMGQNKLREVIFELEGEDPPNQKKYHSAGLQVGQSESYIQIE